MSIDGERGLSRRLAFSTHLAIGAGALVRVISTLAVRHVPDFWSGFCFSRWWFETKGVCVQTLEMTLYRVPVSQSPSFRWACLLLERSTSAVSSFRHDLCSVEPWLRDGSALRQHDSTWTYGAEVVGLPLATR